ncbi:helix-turn-helix domain-containing protein [Mycobacterium sp.]|uniref:helix-turn-helix domain-containing protein n=1 Tax=Mycobacterium sp. TaxID=1785 RepID=UPI003D142E6B
MGYRLARAATIGMIAATTRMPLEEVAAAVGFADPATLHRLARRHTGRSPGALRPSPARQSPQRGEGVPRGWTPSLAPAIDAGALRFLTRRFKLLPRRRAHLLCRAWPVLILRSGRRPSACRRLGRRLDVLDAQSGE